MLIRNKSCQKSQSTIWVKIEFLEKDRLFYQKEKSFRRSFAYQVLLFEHLYHFWYVERRRELKWQASIIHSIRMNEHEKKGREMRKIHNSIIRNIILNHIKSERLLRKGSRPKQIAYSCSAWSINLYARF